MDWKYVKITVEISKTRVPNHYIAWTWTSQIILFRIPMVAVPIEILLPGAEDKLMLPTAAWRCNKTTMFKKNL